MYNRVQRISDDLKYYYFMGNHQEYIIDQLWLHAKEFRLFLHKLLVTFS